MHSLSYLYAGDQAISITDLARTVSETIGLGELMRGDVELLKGAPSQSSTAVSSSSQPITASTFTAPSTPNFNSSASSYFPDTNRIISELALAEIIGLEESLRRTVRYYSL